MTQWVSKGIRLEQWNTIRQFYLFLRQLTAFLLYRHKTAPVDQLHRSHKCFMLPRDHRLQRFSSDTYKPDLEGAPLVQRRSSNEYKHALLISLHKTAYIQKTGKKAMIKTERRINQAISVKNVHVCSSFYQKAYNLVAFKIQGV